MDRRTPLAQSLRGAKPHRGRGTRPSGNGADHRGPGPPEIVGRHARPRARGLPPPRRGQGRPRRPQWLGKEHPVPAPRGRDGAGPGGPRPQARPPVRLPPAGPERPAGDRRARRPLRPEPGGAADRGGARRPRGVDGPPGRLGRRGRERAHGPLRIPPRRPRLRRSESVIVNDPILNDLGVGEELLDQRFGSLSGGEKSKVLTARALANAKEKDVLLLDEPTNHMDVDTIETIEGFLLEIDAAVLLASHDKFLLDTIAEKVIELDRQRTLEYVGNYTDYRVQRDAIARAREAQAHRHQKELKRQ